MRDPNRIDTILHEIGIIWHENPDLRLGQLIGNVLEGPALYYVEDTGLLAALKDLYKGNKEPVNFDSDAYIFDIIKKHPGELCFVLDCATYDDYIKTYTDAGGNKEEAELSEAEFSSLKAYFKDAK